MPNGSDDDKNKDDDGQNTRNNTDPGDTPIPARAVAAVAIAAFVGGLAGAAIGSGALG